MMVRSAERGSVCIVPGSPGACAQERIELIQGLCGLVARAGYRPDTSWVDLTRNAMGDVLERLQGDRATKAKEEVLKPFMREIAEADMLIVVNSGQKEPVRRDQWSPPCAHRDRLVGGLAVAMLRYFQETGRPTAISHTLPKGSPHPCDIWRTELNEMCSPVNRRLHPLCVLDCDRGKLEKFLQQRK